MEQLCGYEKIKILSQRKEKGGVFSFGAVVDTRVGILWNRWNLSAPVFTQSLVAWFKFCTPIGPHRGRVSVLE